jgi:hypothetical protein
MFATANEENQQTAKEEQEEILAMDILRRVFGSERNAPAVSVLEVGVFDAHTTYELTCSCVSGADDCFYTVRVASRHPTRSLDSWLMSGVFWTLDAAESYIANLRSKRLDHLDLEERFRAVT